MKALEKINQYIEELRQLLPMQPAYQQALDRKFRLEFNFNTNHLEGNTLTYGETKLLLLFDDTTGNHTLREYEEMKGSDVAYALILDWAKDKNRELSEKDIKDLNEILLVRPFWKEAITPDGQTTRRLIKVGDYKEFPNSVRLANGELFEYASPIDTPILMGELIQWFREESKKKELHPVQLAALFHYKFVCIHPFDDGNGRISRLLMNYVLLREGLPPVIITSDPVEKKRYLSTLNKADVGDVESFIDYIAQQEIYSLELAIKAAKGEPLDEPGDLEKKITLLKRKLQVSQEEVKIVKSRDAVVGVFEKSIAPLIQQSIRKIQGLDPLFKSKQTELYVDGKIFQDFSSAGLQNISDFLKNELSEHLQLKYSLLHFRKGNVEFSVEAKFDVFFHSFVFEIKIFGSQLNTNKTYDQSLSEDEIEVLAEQLGTSLFNAIEMNMKL